MIVSAYASFDVTLVNFLSISCHIIDRLNSNKTGGFVFLGTSFICPSKSHGTCSHTEGRRGMVSSSRIVDNVDVRLSSSFDFHSQPVRRFCHL